MSYQENYQKWVDYIIFFSFSKTLSASKISSNQVRLNLGFI